MTKADGNGAADFDLKSRSTYTHWTDHTIRYNDLDVLGHVNNAVYSTFFEAGRTMFMEEMAQEMTGNGRNIDFVLARVTIDFLKELRYPGSVDIGSRVYRIGTKSMSFVNGVFRHDTDECVATCEAVLVFFDLDERASCEPPAKVRAFLEANLRGE